MGIWDEVKKIFKNFKLVEIKNEVHLHGDVNLNYKGDNIHYSVPEEKRSKISSIKVTPELEKEYESKFVEFVKARESYLASLPEDEMRVEVASTSVSTAVEILSGEIPLSPSGESKSPADFLDFDNIGEEASMTTIRSTGPPKKPWGSDDEGETA